jgi:t-SNARE complex subunit (syntaxin)
MFKLLNLMLDEIPKSCSVVDFINSEVITSRELFGASLKEHFFHGEKRT